MPATSQNTAVETIVARLFSGELCLLDEWLQQTQQRMDALHQLSELPKALYAPDANRLDKQAVLQTLCEQIQQHGFALYAFTGIPDDIETAVLAMLQQLSLVNGDSGVIRESGALSLLQDLSGTPQGKFPPYQSQQLNWHTDGYYNALSDTVRCFTLHCVEPASDGGDLIVMDDNFLILALFQEDPTLVALLTHPEAMTLPANKDAVGHNRPDRTVPVIQKHEDGALTLRFTTRARNIRWRCTDTQAAAERAVELIDTNKHLQVRLHLRQGEGIVTRNILHAREAFHDRPGHSKRQMLRGRFPTLPEATMKPISETPGSSHAACK